MLKLVLSLWLILPIGLQWQPDVDPVRTVRSFVVVNKQKNELALLQLGKVQKVYKVATGKTNDLTPEGEFTVVHRAKDPYFIKLKIPGGDPKNPLGTRWIGFDARGTHGTKYGIHGTNQSWSIGKYLSNGCIRMYNKDVEELYEQVPYGATVYIVNTSKSFSEIGRSKGWVYP